MHGSLTGERMIEVINSILFENITNGLKAIIGFNNVKKSYWTWESEGSLDGIEGFIYKSKNKTPLTPTHFGKDQQLMTSID